MPLTNGEQAAVARELAERFYVRPNRTANLDNDECKALVGDVYAFLEANAAAINQAIRAGIRSKATTEEKAAAVALAAMRYGGLL